ncbi:MAG: hypothetical protein K0R67_1565 [Paenibacillus sp.]|jgi:hypothetical protein|nr:hypothetical protein [Paenibacillus sp.]
MNKKVWIFGLVVAIAIIASAISERISTNAQVTSEYKPVPLMKFDGASVHYFDNVAVCH